MSPITTPPAGWAGAGGAAARNVSSMVVATGGSLTLALLFGRGEEPPAPTFSNASLGFSGGGGAICGRLPGEATGGGGTAEGSILGGSIGAGIAGTAGGAGNGARERGACGTG